MEIGKIFKNIEKRRNKGNREIGEVEDIGETRDIWGNKETENTCGKF